MSPDNREDLLLKIDNHHAAMRAQVDDPGVRLEFLHGDGTWKAAFFIPLVEPSSGVVEARWHRLAPTPPMVPLDQSDFLGPNRVTHLRRAGVVYTISSSHDTGVGVGLTYKGAAATWEYAVLRTGDWECSRDGGATWQRCEKAGV